MIAGIHKLEFKVRYWVIRRLGLDQGHTSIESGLAASAIWWGIVTIVFPLLQETSPIYPKVQEQTFGHPWLIGVFLIAFGIINYQGLHFKSLPLRLFASSGQLFIWSWFTVAYSTQLPLGSGAFAWASAATFGQVLCWVGIHLETTGIIEPTETEFLKKQLEEIHTPLIEHATEDTTGPGHD